MLLWGVLIALAEWHDSPAESDSMAAYGFEVCDLPCWSGIRPGETAADSVIPLLQTHVPRYESASMPEKGVIAFQFVGGIGGSFGYRDVVQQMYLLNLEIPFHQMIQWLAPPDCVYTGGVSAPVLMWYREGYMIVSVFSGDSPEIPMIQDATLTGLMIYPEKPDFCALYPPWQGFAPSWFYQQQVN